MKRLLLGWEYSFYRVQSYLAVMMDDKKTADNMLSIANNIHRLWCVEKIQ